MNQSGNENLENNNNNGNNDNEMSSNSIHSNEYHMVEDPLHSGLEDHVKKVKAESIAVDAIKDHTNDTEFDKEEKEEKEINYMKEIGEMILYFLVVLALVAFVYTFIGEQVEVSGSSMESTLQDQNHLILEKVSYRFHEPKRFDIVVFRPYEDNDKLYFIKRIIGLPGETVQIKGSDIYINGKILEENYGREPIEDGGIAKDPITLGEDEYFVLGDNRNNSKDSRFEEVGLVDRDSIIGRAWMRIWPLDEAGILKHR